MERTNIAAYTAEGSSYPEYLSINREPNGMVSVTVRSPPGDTQHTAAILIPLAAWDYLASKIISDALSSSSES